MCFLSFRSIFSHHSYTILIFSLFATYLTTITYSSLSQLMFSSFQKRIIAFERSAGHWQVWILGSLKIGPRINFWAFYFSCLGFFLLPTSSLRQVSRRFSLRYGWVLSRPVFREVMKKEYLESRINPFSLY